MSGEKVEAEKSSPPHFLFSEIMEEPPKKKVNEAVQ